jgi:hypothetical protein
MNTPVEMIAGDIVAAGRLRYERIALSADTIIHTIWMQLVCIIS